MLTVFIKFGDLASYLVLRPLRHLLESVPVTVSFEPMLERLGDVAGKPGTDDPLAEYKARRATARKSATIREFERQCEMLELSLEAGKREIEPSLLSAGLAWANQQGEVPAVLDYLDLAFEKTYRAQADVASLDVVAGLLSDSGIQTDGFASFVTDYQGDQTESLIERGILLAPAFILDDEIFLGREHLPLITWLLSGQKGPPPV
jgi:2-hydroxychromene-2-carboxylate isomerase